MHRSSTVLLFVATVALTTAGTGCSPASTALNGRVAEDRIVIEVPSLTATATAGTWTRVTSVTVEPGDTVEAGDVLVELDGAAVDADILAARMGARAAAAQVRVLDERLGDLTEARGDIGEARGTANDAVAQLTDTRSELLAQRAKLASLLATIEKMRPPGGVPPTTTPPGATPPPGSTPPPGATPPPGSTPPPGAPGSSPGTLPSPAELRAGIAKIDAALAKIDAGLSRARSGLAQLADASATVADARATVIDLRELARIAAEAAKVPVRMAALRRSLATVRSPEAGVVVSVHAVGDILNADAPLAVIEPVGPVTASVWMTPEQADALETRLRRGPVDAVATTDWSRGRVAEGRVVRVGTRAHFPPTSLATKEVHLARAVEVTVEFEDPPFALPAGAPVDVRIR